MRAGWLLLLVGCVGGDDLERALTGSGSPEADALLVRVPDARLPRDVGPGDADATRDGAPPPDAVPPLDAAPPVDATPDAARCDDREGSACQEGVGVCRERGRLVCVDGALVCDAVPGAPAAEQCDGRDNDCDGVVDEAVSNACGRCGVPPDEVCNGVDDDCNGVVDEGLQNACGGCGPVPAEACDGEDQDCDGQVDEGGVCRAWVLLPGSNRWITPTGLNALLADGRIVDSVATFFTDSAELWAFVGDRIHIYRFVDDQWVADLPLAILPGVQAPVQTAEAVPLWWRLRSEPQAVRSSLVLTRGEEVRTLDVDPFARTADGVAEAPVWEAWSGDPRAPDAPLDLRASVIDLRNTRGFWQGRPRDICREGPPVLGPTVGILNRDRLHIQEAGTCFLFVNEDPADAWPGFNLINAPAPAAITAWTHVEPEEPGGGVEVIFTR